MTSSGSSVLKDVNISMTTLGRGNAVGLFTAGHHVLKNVSISVSAANAQGFYTDAGTIEFNNVVITAEASAGDACGINYASTAILTDVNVSTAAVGTNYALYNWSQSPNLTNLTNVTAVAKDGTSNFRLYISGTNHVTTVDRSTLEGATNSVYQANSGILRIGTSKLAGRVGGDFPSACVATSDGNYQLLNNQCQ